MNRILIALMLLACAGSFGAEPELPQYNFLFIVDTSISMAARKALAAELVREIITSGFQGRIAEGDSIDIWTYSTETHLTGFPPQIWDTNRAARIASAASSFIEREKFSGRTRFISVATDLGSLLPSTRGLLVLLITDGTEKLEGTGFDAELNRQIPALARRLKDPKQPLCISLAAVNGRFTDWAIFGGPGRPVLAKLPSRVQPEALKQAEKTASPPPRVEPVKPKPETIAPVVVEFPPGAKVTPAPVTPAAPSPEPRRSSEEPAAVIEERPPETVALPKPTNAAVQKALTETQLAEENTRVGPGPAIEAEEPKPIPPSPAQRELATAQPSFHFIVFAGAAGVLLVLTGALLWRKGKSKTGPSLISKSLDR